MTYKVSPQVSKKRDIGYRIISLDGLERHIEEFVFANPPSKINTSAFLFCKLVYDDNDEVCLRDMESNRLIKIQDGFEIGIAIKDKNNGYTRRRYIFEDSSD